MRNLAIRQYNTLLDLAGHDPQAASQDNAPLRLMRPPLGNPLGTLGDPFKLTFHAGLDCVRLGHPARVLPALHAHTLEALAERATLVVTDQSPVFDLPQLVSAATRRLRCRFEAIDGYGIVPLENSTDGRIADICETCFLDGSLVIPQFVLKELQLVADSSDSMKRNRGRRGLDILQRIQKIAYLDVQIVEDDFPSIREVDMKLIELAKVYEGKIITNDFNLNKVAQVRGVEVLNINELANALKPVVLPGETMRVFIQKEGKEPTQGVAYLDDGTMVVVDNARKLISKTIDITVTSVL